MAPTLLIILLVSFLATLPLAKRFNLLFLGTFSAFVGTFALIATFAMIGVIPTGWQFEHWNVDQTWVK